MGNFDVGHPAYQNDPAVFDVATLFQQPASSDPGVPTLIRLVSASPNPFSAKTSIRLSLASPGVCRLAAYGLDGSLVALLHDGWLEAGAHNLRWHDAPGNGVYVVKTRYPHGYDQYDGCASAVGNAGFPGAGVRSSGFSKAAECEGTQVSRV